MGHQSTPVGRRCRGAHWFSGRVHEVVDEVIEGGLGLLPLDALEAGETVVDLLRAAERLTGIALKALAHADASDVAGLNGATSTQAWLAHAANLPHGVARGLVKQAQRLEADYDATAVR